MNEELFLLFCEMNLDSRKVLDQAFSKSPKMLQLVNFLKTIKTPFKTPKAIHVIYSAELDSVEYAKLINRFYKLRQQLIEWLYHYLKKTENYTSKEEQRLNFIRYLVNKNQFKNALEKGNFYATFLHEAYSHADIIIIDINLDVQKETNKENHTLGANIHDLLSDSFFMDEGFMGAYAMSKIKEVI